MRYEFSKIADKEEWISELLFPQFLMENRENTYFINDIAKYINEKCKKCLYLTGDSGFGKTQSAREILRVLQNQYDFLSVWYDCKNFNLEQYLSEESEIKMCNSKKRIVVCYDGFNNLSEIMMKEVARHILKLNQDNISVIVTTIKIPAEINEIVHVELHAKQIEEERKFQYLKGCANENAMNLLPILESPILLRMVKETDISVYYHGYINGMKSICRTASDVFWNYNLSFMLKRTDDDGERKIRLFTFQFLTGIVADIMFANSSPVINKNYFIDELQRIELEGYIEYCLDSVELDDVWYREGKGAEECINILISFNILSRNTGGDILFFSHDLYEVFYLALHEYNLTYWAINRNKNVPSKVTLNNRVGKFYFGLFDNAEIKNLRNCAEIRYGSGKENFTAIRANNVLSDIYYYGNGSTIVQNIEYAYEYSRKSYELGDGWATWNCVYLLKEMALAGEKEKFEIGFNMLNDYLKRCTIEAKEVYFAVYDMLAQYFMNGWVDITKNDELRYEKAEQYLIKAEEGNYMFSFNKHARLYEEGKLRVKKGEDKYQKAYELYKKAAKQQEMWAVAMIALYKWHLYDHIGSMVINKQEARERAREELESHYQRVEEFAKAFTLERRSRYKNGFMNLGLIYVEKGEEARDEISKREHFIKAYDYYCQAHETDMENDVNIYLMLYYLQIRLGKNLDEKWVGLPLQEVLYSKKICRNYDERERKLGLDWGEKYQYKLRKIMDFAMKMSDNSKGKEDLFGCFWEPKKYTGLVCDIIDFVDEKTSIESIFQLIFERSKIKNIFSKMTGEKNIVPGMIMVFGDETYQKIIVDGNRQEVLMIEGTLERKLEKFECDTLIDLASVTKIFTCIVTMKLFELGEIDINSAIGEYDDRFQFIKEVTIKKLMNFSVPLETAERISKAESAETAEKMIFEIKVALETPDRKYSDMGAMVLKYILERKTGKSFWQLVQEYILNPCNMNETYCHIVQENKEKCENNNYERQISNEGYKFDYMTEKGVCQDPKARILKKNASSLQGHAGLFSTAGDMAKFAQCLIQEKLITKNSMEMIGKNYTGKVIGENKYCQFLGMLTYVKNPIQKESEVYHALASHAFSMGGYSGTYFTVDFVNKIFLFIGSNRCHNRITVSEKDEKIQLWSDGNKYVCSKKFAWERDKVAHKALDLAIQLKFVREFLDKKEEMN